MRELAVVAVIALAVRVVVASTRLTRNAAALSQVAIVLSLLALYIAWHALRKASIGDDERSQQVRERVGDELDEPTDSEA